jgi:hypothetical protein
MHSIIIIFLFVLRCNSYCTDSIFYGDANACLNNNQIPCYNGGGLQCLCTDECFSAEGTCVNNTISKPLTTMSYPQYCYSRSNFSDTDVNCNYYGNGTFCPYGCVYENKNCKQINSNIICHPYIDWACPNGCAYNKNSNSCIPLSVDSICGLIERTLTCPSGCNYNNYLNKCISTNPNYLCGLERNLLCPQNCKLNIRGDTCIGSTYVNTVYDLISVPQCPNGCYYDTNTNICKTTDHSNRYVLCEPIVSLQCPHNSFTINVQNYPDCNNNPYDICNYYGTEIRYPLRLQYRYAEIMCNYSSQGNCENKRIKRICCN